LIYDNATPILSVSSVRVLADFLTDAVYHCLQREANLLQDMNMTRVVAIGMGPDVGRTELYNIASHPHELNVIMAPDFSSLTVTNVENHVVRAICGKH